MSTSQEIRMRVGQNIRRRREEMNLSQEELAHAIGKKSRSAISKIEKGTNDVGQSDLLAIAAALDTTAADLLDGPKILSDLTQNTQRIVRLPVLGAIAGGIPIEAYEDATSDEYVDFSPPRRGDDQKFMALRVEGDSMEPQISDGDTAILELCYEWHNGAVMAVYVNGYNATLKRVRIDHNGYLTLQPFNPSHEPQTYTPEEQQSLPVKPLGLLLETRKKWQNK